MKLSMRKFTTHVCVAVATVALFLTMAFGQATRSTLSGLINDSAGAAVSGAVVTARHVATSQEFRATTDAQGAFTFPSLPLGQFTVVIEASGFKRSEVQAVMVEISTPAKLNVALEVGTVNEAVIITGESQEVVNTTSATLTNVINTRQVRDLPLPTRNPLDLARLQAGIAVTGDDTRNASIGGLRGSGTNVTQDGINAMDNFVKTSSFFAISAPSLNSTSEFSVSVGTIGSESGRGVAQVTMVTKSGTNEFHGGVFWQHRNDALNANTFFNNLSGTPKTILRENFFGGSIGGPVWLPRKLFGPAAYDGRGKSLWFFSYEGFRSPFSATRNRTVLTEQARKGIFQYTGANGQLQAINLLQIGNFSALNPVTGALLSAMPLPNNTLVGDSLNTAGYRYNVPGTSPNDKYVGRFDQQLLENSRIGSHKLEFVYNHAEFLLKPDTFNGLEAPFPGGVDSFQASKRILTTAAIHSTFGAHVTNEVRVGHQRAPVGFLRDSQPTNYFINFGSVTDYDLNFLSQGRNSMVYQYIDNLSVLKGSHTFRFGGDVQSITAYTFNDAGINQVINLGTNSANPDGILNNEFPNLPSGSTGTAIVTRARSVYSDIVGLLASSTRTFNISSPTSGFVPGATRERIFKQRWVSLYGQDQWRVRRNFTLNLGVRWEFQGVPFETKGIAIQPVGGLTGLFGISGENNLFAPGSLKGQATTSIDFVNGDTGKKLYNDDWNNLAPYIGIAYSPNFERGPMRWIFGPEGKGSIRAGYSISYLQDGFTVVSNALGTGTTNPGLIQTASNTNPTGVLTSAGIPLTTPTFKIPITDAENFAINTGNGLWSFDPNLRVPYVQQWSFGIEREVANNTAVEVRYVGNHAVKIYRAIDYNEANIFENGFLQEFLNAQKNLTINGGSSFAPGAAGTVALPIFSTLFGGLSSSSGYTNSTFISNLLNNNVGAIANTLAYSNTYRNNRAKLTFNGQPAPNFFVANPNAAFARALTNASFSNYNSLQMEIRRRMSKGLMLQANYTFSKSLTDSEGSQSTLESYRTIRNVALDRHLSDTDQRHRVIGNFIYELPFGNGRKWLNGIPGVSKIVEGWSIGGIFTWQTGSPLGVFSNRSTFNNFNAANNPAQLVGITLDELRNNVGVYKTSSGVYFFNPSLLSITTNSSGGFTGSTLKSGLLDAPDPGKFGNFPINSIIGPSFWQADFSVSKRTKMYESAEVEFKATFYNAFNHANFTFGSPTFDSASFGRISGQRGSPRIIHFILGINF
ncbi:MAG: TonB-dependent receptor [Acidobacteria bacterium]|nr:TonB-dependent receptor [Acidobacteriota bacterium]